jgi:hypothetical protein
VVNLVFGSFVVALTPVVLGLAWKLAAGISHGIAVVFTGCWEDAEQSKPLVIPAAIKVGLSSVKAHSSPAH